MSVRTAGTCHTHRALRGPQNRPPRRGCHSRPTSQMGQLRLPEALDQPRVLGGRRGSPCRAPRTDTRWSCWGSHHCWCCTGPGADTLSRRRSSSRGSGTGPARWGSLSTGPVGSRAMAGRGQGLQGREKAQVCLAPKSLSPPQLPEGWLKEGVRRLTQTLGTSPLHLPRGQIARAGLKGHPPSARSPAPGSQTHLGIRCPAGCREAGTCRRGPVQSTGSCGDSAGPGTRAALSGEGRVQQGPEPQVGKEHRSRGALPEPLCDSGRALPSLSLS